jgi:hypothetical protein
MRSRRDSLATDNLGLLLDAICNTFGAVLLIAILVAVLLSTSAKELIPSEEQLALLETLNNVKDQRISLETEKEKLELILKDILGVQPTGPKAPDGQLETLRTEVNLLRTKKDQIENDLDNLREKPILLKKEESELQDQVEELRQTLILETNKRTEVAHFPVLETDLNEQIAILIRYDRLYLTHTYNDNAERIGINTKDMILDTTANGDIEARAKPTSGIDLTTKESSQQVKHLLRIFDPQRHSIVLFTGRGSFDSYRPVTDILVELGFNFFPWPMTDEGVWDRGGEGGVSQ